MTVAPSGMRRGAAARVLSIESRPGALAPPCVSPRDLRLGLVEASQNKVGSWADQVLLLCYEYDPAAGKYGFAILSSLRIGALLTLGGLALFIAAAARKERRKSSERAS